MIDKVEGLDLRLGQLANPSDPDRVAELESQLTEAEAAYQQVQEDIAARGAKLASLVPGRSKDYILEVEQVQAKLEAKTTLISYFVLEDKVLAFVLTRDSFEVIPLEVSQEDLLQKIILFRDFADITTPYPDTLNTLYGWLIEPLKPHLNTPHLTIIPHDVLHYLPFAALTDGERYLIDDYTLTTLPTASTLPFIQDKSKAQQDTSSTHTLPLILGNPDTGEFDPTTSLVVEESQYRSKFGPLPFAGEEAQAIAALYGVEPLIEEAATEEAVREGVAAANILHLAAHGEFNAVAPLNSLIALAPDPDESYNGWLTVGEVYGLDLSNTNLVVLSACETHLDSRVLEIGQGVTAGDELVGLTRAFIYAGTPSIITSLWSVDDEATSLLMERFYTHLQAGMDKAKALRQAQIEMREDYPNPYYWAAFVLSGDGGVVPGSGGAGEQGGVETEMATSTESIEAVATGDETVAEERQSGGNCLGLVVIFGVLGVVGVGVRQRVSFTRKAGKAPVL